MWYGQWDSDQNSPGGAPYSCGVNYPIAPVPVGPGEPGTSSVLTAVGDGGGIYLTWSYPAINPHMIAYTAIYRSTSSNYAEAVKIGEAGGNTYIDRLNVTVTYFYWVRFISQNTGLSLAVIGPASATATPRISAIMAELTDQIDRGMLATALKNELDGISLLNADLLQEITDRELGYTTLAQGIAAAELGIANANTFLLEEVNSRVAQNSATIESINLVAATLGDDIASVNVSLTANIDAVNDTVYSMYMAKLTVNGLVGGFGIVNDGASVEAGFDVDTFWIGKTSVNKVKPFLVSGGVVYIDSARIQSLSADIITVGTLNVGRIANGALTNMWYAEEYFGVTIPASFAEIVVCTVSVTQPSSSAFKGIVLATINLGREIYAGQTGMNFYIQKFQGGVWSNISIRNVSFPSATAYYNISGAAHATWLYEGTPVTHFRLVVTGNLVSTGMAEGYLTVQTFVK